MKRGGALRRRTPLRQGVKGLRRTRLLRDGATPLNRSGPLKVKGRSRFPGRRCPAYRAWIRTFPCVVPGCPRLTVCCHVKSQGAAGDDVGDCFPGCRAHHDEQHAHGLDTFQVQYGLDLEAISAAYGRLWALRPPEAS